MGKRKRIGIFGWGLVAPKSPNIETFAKNLKNASSWLGPFDGYGPNNFLVGNPDFNFRDYKPWVDDHFEPRKFSQLDAKMGNPVKYAIGAFIQALSLNKGMETLLPQLGTKAHIYVGGGLGDIPLQYEIYIAYYKAQKRWNKFWCRPAFNSKLAVYEQSDKKTKAEIREAVGAPDDPSIFGEYDDRYEDTLENWLAFWLHHSEGLATYLRKIRDVEGISVEGDIETAKGHVIRHKIAARKKINKEYGCPPEPWASVDTRILWNIPNISAAQISMLGRITGAAIAPIAACSGFITALKLADNAIQLGEAKVAVVGMADPAPHALTVGGFYGARVISHDGMASKPFTGLRGTHISGGACIWIVGDYDYLIGQGMRPVGLEIMGIGLSADAHHIITPNAEGPKAAIRKAMQIAKVTPDDVGTWDMHATATPGDWTELSSALGLFPESTYFTARKGSFGHGMSVCGGWELTAQHLGVSHGHILPVNVDEQELHEMIRPYAGKLVKNKSVSIKKGQVTGKINMGVGGVNGCVICRPYPRN